MLKQTLKTLVLNPESQALSMSDETREATTTFNLCQKEGWSGIILLNKEKSVFPYSHHQLFLLFLIPHYHNTLATQGITSLELQGIPIRTKAADEIPSPPQKTTQVFLHSLLCPIYVSSVVQKSAADEKILAESIWELQHVKMINVCKAGWSSLLPCMPWEFQAF